MKASLSSKGQTKENMNSMSTLDYVSLKAVWNCILVDSMTTTPWTLKYEIYIPLLPQKYLEESWK